jgi:hypothetical protein
MNMILTKGSIISRDNFGHFGLRPFVQFIAKCINRGNMVMEGEKTAESAFPVVWRQTRYQEVGWVVYRFIFDLCDGLMWVQNNHTSCAASKWKIILYST